MVIDGQSRFWLAVAAGLVLCVWVLGPILMPFLVGIVLGFLLDPVCDGLERLGLKRGAAAGVVIGGAALGSGALLVVLVPFLWSQLVDLAVSLPALKTRALAALHPYWELFRPYLGAKNLSGVEDFIGSSFGTIATTLGSLTGQALAGGAALVDLASLAVVTPVVAFYLLKDWEAIGAWLNDHLPRPAAPVVRKYGHEILRTLAAWLRGQMLLCVILAAYYGLALTAAGLRFGLLLGLLTGLVAFIPFVGFGLGLGAALISAFFSFDGWSGWTAVLGVFAVGQVLEGYVLTPRLVGHSVGLHEIWVIFAVMAGGHLFGFLGVLLAIPAAAVIGVLVRAGLVLYRSSVYFTGDGSEAKP